MPKKSMTIKYFNKTQKDIELFWSRKTHSIHYGYYDNTHTTHNSALANMNRILAETAKIKHGEKILDAGCGIGGSAIYLAKNHGAKVTGININTNQIKKAKELARKNNIQHRTEFYTRDFTDTKQPPRSFDVVWAIESTIFAEKKKDFLKEAKRILKPKGRLIIADIFKKENLKEDQKKELEEWLENWGSPYITTTTEFKTDLEALDFKKIEFKDITENIEPSSRRMYIGSIFIYLLYWLTEKIGLKTKTEKDMIKGAYHQHKALKKGQWKYYIISAQKS